MAHPFALAGLNRGDFFVQPGEGPVFFQWLRRDTKGHDVRKSRNAGSVWRGVMQRAMVVHGAATDRQRAGDS